MAAVSQKVPNLLGGVSQQPDPVKLPGQVRVAENVYLDPTFGCRKRPGTNYIKTIASDLPADAKWFPIFRDDNERYAVVIYQSNGPVCRIWDLNNGVERTVSISDTSRAYLSGAVLNDINHLTVSDYTLLSNKNATVTMSGVQSDTAVNEAFVAINQVSYNTTYAIDILKEDTELETVKIYTATGVEVTPGSYEKQGGTCVDQAITPFEINEGNKTGLRGDIVNQCTPFLRDDDDDDNDQDSRYTVSVTLKNGGVNFRVGEEYEVTAPGGPFTIRITSEKFTYGYDSAGTVNYTSPLNSDEGLLSVTDITVGLVNAINAVDGFSAESVGNVVKITSEDDEAFNVSARGGSANSAMTAIKGSVQNITNLPPQCFDGSLLKVSNTDEADADDYYVQFKSQAAGIPGAGSWLETVAPDTQTLLNSSTMPQALIRQADGSFTLEPLNSDSAFGGWGVREVGDETSNPTPSFVGKGISSIFFYANRMGFLSEDSVILSQPGDYFNFFSTSALAISDADPIDLTASSTAPAILKSAVGSPKGLILFAERSQFLLSTTEIVFSSATVKLAEISNYFYKSEVRPLNAGSSIAFVSENISYSKVMEMATDSVENRPVVADITKNAPEFLPAKFTWGEVMPNNDLFAFGDGTSDAYIFKYFNNGDTRELAGWAKWIYPMPVKMFAAEDDLIYIILDDGENTIYCKSELVDDPDTAPMSVGFSRFSPRLDVSLTSDQVTVATVDAGTSSVTIPADRYISDQPITFMSVEGDYKGTFINPDVTDNPDGSGTFNLSTPLLSGNYVVGYDYSTKVSLPSIFVKQENVADRTNVPMVSFVHLDLYYSGHYTVTVDKLGYASKTIEVEQIYANVYDANDTPVSEINQITVPVFAPGNDVFLTIEGTGPYPSSITSYSWDGTYNIRGVNPLK